jgi:mannose-1-phosphate guanylyltransferase
MERRRGDRWAIVLAAGEGTRMARLVEMVNGGRVIPKQYAPLIGDRSLLDLTLGRLRALVPAERTVVVVGPGQEDLARPIVDRHGGGRLVSQPVDLGTGPGTVIGLCHVLAEDPEARVLVTPATQHVRDDASFVEDLSSALDAAEDVPSGVVVLGAEPTRPDPDLGWIVPEQPRHADSARARPVRRVFGSAPAPLAELLLGMATLWSTGIVAGRAEALWRMCARAMPGQLEHFRHYLRSIGRAHERRLREEIYRELLPADLQSEVLPQVRGLAVSALRDEGWTDCTTPERLFEALRGTPALAELLGRLRRARPPALVRPSPAHRVSGAA